jgi:hypothetical protein
MALFLVRQVADHGVAIPAAANQGYTDIGALPASTQDAINQVTQLGISKGTSTTTFSPNDGVTRWQMALFIYRTGLAASVTFSSNTAHNEFADIGGLSAEAQTAINALTDTRPDPEGHIALGIGGSLFAPNLVLVRWQMALFLTRLLAADNIVAPSGTRVVVAPSALATLNTGQARTYTATFKNADGTPYTGRVGIELVEASSGAPVYNDKADFVTFEATTDGLVGLASAELNGVAGTDGVVTFTIRHSGTAEDTIPVAWEDLNLDSSYGVGNVAPSEPFGLGGVSDFVAGAPPEAGSAAHGATTVDSTTKASDSFTGTTGAACSGAVLTCTFFYDANDIFSIGAVAATLQEFEDALSIGDVLTVNTYAADAAGQSTFNLTDNTAALTVDDPAAPVTVDANNYSIVGTSDPGATIRIHDDINDDGNVDPGEGILATAVADVDGNWTVVTPLQQGVVNNFSAVQVPVGGVATAGIDVPAITEGASVGATLTSTVAAEGGAVDAGLLGPGDTLTITFSENIANVSATDTVTVVDTDGTTAVLTLGPDVSFGVAANVLTLTINVAVPGTGGTGGIAGASNVTAITGFTDDDGETINVAGSGAGRSFTAV